MTRILHLSDPHFGAERPDVVEALVAFGHEIAPTAVVLSGDVTQRARAAQFEAAGRFLARLPPVPRLVIPGNHDIPLFNLFGRFLDPYAGFRRLAGPQDGAVCDMDGLLVLGVRTTRRWRHVQGSVSRMQVDAVAERLRRAAPGQLRVVVVHQPVWVPLAVERKNLLRGRELAIRSWAQAGADLILGGHIHLPFVQPLRGGPPDASRVIWVVQAGTAVSHRVRNHAGNSVNVIEWLWRSGHGSCRVAQYDHDPVRQRFVQVRSTHLDIDRIPVDTNA